MARYRFDEIVVNVTQKKTPTEEDQKLYVGLEHLDSESLVVSRWGSNVPIKGEKLIMRKGDVLLGKRNAYLRRAAIAPHDGIFSAHGMVLRPNEDIVDRNFFPFFISSDYFFDEAVRISVGSLSPTVNWSDLRRLEFDLPEMDEQKKLARVLWAVNDTIEAYKRLISATDDLVRGRFVEMFGDPLKNEREWEYRLLPEVADIVLGSTPKSTEPAYWDGNIKWITPAEIQDDAFIINDTVRHITPEGVKAANLKPFPTGTVIFSTRAPIGKTAIAGCEMYCNQGFKNFVCKHEMNPIYLLALLRIYKNYFINMGTGTTFKELSKASLERVAISVPPYELQQQFADFVYQADKSKSSLQNALTAAKNISRKIISENLR